MPIFIDVFHGFYLTAIVPTFIDIVQFLSNIVPTYNLFLIVFSTSASLEPSYVLRALGAEEDMAHSSIRSYVWKPLSPLTNISF